MKKKIIGKTGEDRRPPAARKEGQTVKDENGISNKMEKTYFFYSKQTRKEESKCE